MNNATNNAIVQVRGAVKTFAGVATAVDHVSLDIFEGEFFALLGPSGCGKTTFMRMLAGLEIPDRGEILIDGRDMTGVPPNRRPVNMVFQSYAVFPHMSVLANIAYGLKVTGVGAADIRRRVDEALQLVQLGGLEQRMPAQLSGGQLQRVALARALVKRPRVLLLDEPLSALDAKLREAMQLELVKLQHAVGITFIIVTHDQQEALSMADRIAVMEKGKVRQVAPPAELYEYPRSYFVADFIGKMNLFHGQAGGDGAVAVEQLGEIKIPGNSSAGRVGIAVRPEKVKLFRDAPRPGFTAFKSTVDNIAYHGSESYVFATTESGAAIAATVQNESRDSKLPAVGDSIWCGWRAEDTLVLEE